MSQDQVILHHYPQSPVSEKVRVVLGMKNLAWKSVEIPRLPPKPNLMPLTGGYRLTPVMQIGADIYCDTKCIIRELERRFPEPTLFPGGAAGMAWGVGQWTDGPLFQDVINVALGEMSPNMPPEFLADRGPLYFGPDFSLENIKDRYAECLTNIRAQFGWMDKRVAARDFMLGAEPGLPGFLAQFQNLLAWEQRVKNIGHGRPEDLGDLEALEIAAKAEPQTPEQADPGDPMGLKIGDRIGIEPASGGPQVVGRLHSLSANHAAILREDDQAGQVCVRFPRIGYRIKRF